MRILTSYFYNVLRVQGCTRGLTMYAVIRDVQSLLQDGREVEGGAGERKRWKTGVHADVENMSRIIVHRDTDR